MKNKGRKLQNHKPENPDPVAFQQYNQFSLSYYPYFIFDSLH